MGKFLVTEKPVQTEFKNTSSYFSDAARVDGVYRSKSYPFCLPLGCAQENLYLGIQQTAVEVFTENKIKWHDGKNGNPSTHLCDSMVCCVNFLFPFFDQPAALAELLKPIYPDLQEMLLIENDSYVSFEWIGEKNYLGERVSRNGNRTRGANCTSVDAAVTFLRSDGRRQIVLIEWKYTESYSPTSYKFAKSGTDRTAIYAPLFEADHDLLDKTLLPGFDSLFFEPFYQFMRQQYLANEMEKAHELGADIVSLLHIAPAHNLDFKKITSSKLRSLGDSATKVWDRLVKKTDRFHSVSTEELFGNFDTSQFPQLQNWQEYITARYAWVTQ